MSKKYITPLEIEVMKGYTEGESPYQEVEEVITSVDPGDGGHEADWVIRENDTGKYWGFSATQWDTDTEFSDGDDQIEMTEVFQKTKTITYYE